MSRTFLELARDLVAELGEGSGPPAVTGQTGNMGNIVRWIAEADVYIQNLWRDWDFMWTKVEDPTLNLNEGDSTITGLSATLATPVERGLSLFVTPGRAWAPQWVPWREFVNRFENRDKPTRVRPGHWSCSPDGTIVLSDKIAQDTPWSLEYYKRPVRMAQNGDRSPIPEDFDRIIIVRAAIIYGVREDAPELVRGYSGEYDDYMEKMEGRYLPGNRFSRRSQSDGLPDPDFLGRIEQGGRPNTGFLG